AEVVGFIQQMGSALLAVHGAGLVHRDAHPGNIMILPPNPRKLQREAILIDFGIAGEMFPSTVSSKFFGNPAFAPYEQFGKPADPSMDVYTLAASCYFAVTGVLPESAMNRKLYGRGLVAPRQHRGTLSQGLNAAILAGMELEAGDRPNLSEWLRLFQPQESRVKTPSGFTKSSQDQNVNAGIAQPIAQVWDIDAVPLQSEKKVDYTRLRDLLKVGKWKEADQETKQRMLEATGRTNVGLFQNSDLLNFPCTDLKTIDQLWAQASQGRYGFSIQQEIYVKCGGKLDGKHPDDQIWNMFGEKVGWRINDSWAYYGNLKWNRTNVLGYLPWAVVCARVDLFSSLTSRLVKCN
ncbi:MAG: GUN4 domain-containing protein, partial [Prochlorothrix sp.]